MNNNNNDFKNELKKLSDDIESIKIKNKMIISKLELELNNLKLLMHKNITSLEQDIISLYNEKY